MYRFEYVYLSPGIVSRLRSAQMLDLAVGIVHLLDKCLDIMHRLAAVLNESEGDDDENEDDNEGDKVREYTCIQLNLFTDIYIHIHVYLYTYTHVFICIIHIYLHI
jgi:hypothetical protein